MRSPRNPQLNSPALVELLKLEIFELSKKGYSCRKIAEEMKAKHNVTIDHSTVNVYKNQVLKELVAERNESAEEYRQMQLARYHALLSALWEGATNEKRVDLGKVDRALSILNSINKLEGLDKPVKSHVFFELDQLLSQKTPEERAEAIRLLESGEETEGDD